MKLAGLKRPLTPLQTAVERVAGSVIGPVARQVIEIPMSAVDRRRVRRRLQAPDGTELLLAFPTGTVLTPGTLLDTRGDVSYVVRAAPEDVAVITPRTLGEMAQVAHAIGNLHRDLVEDSGTFLTLWDAPVELLLTRLGVPFTREFRPFEGRPSWEHEL
ncbi:urease accessory protein UreE [Deinococcus sp.]|uniref:urease accessory protein UreE n=1 Tax=Deinococcus sp. TaxID=47478 RepID=UPI0025C6FB5E|nr:urease accessory protein UreE [Deinococcus sp.]